MVERLERVLMVEVPMRALLVAVAIVNWSKARWTFNQFGEASWSADLGAAVLEGALVCFSYVLTRRLVSNANRRRKTDPVRPTLAVWLALALFVGLSAFCNALAYTTYGRLHDPLKSDIANMVAGVVLGIAAPVVAGIIAYVTGEEAGTEAVQREADQERRERNRRRREGRAKPSASKRSGARGGARKTKTREAILEALNEEGLASNITALARAVGVSRPTVYAHLGELEAEGLIRRNDGNGYEKV